MIRELRPQFTLATQRQNGTWFGPFLSPSCFVQHDSLFFMVISSCLSPSHFSKSRIETGAFPPSPYQNLLPFVVSVVVVVVGLFVVVGFVSAVTSVDLFVVSVVSAVVVFGLVAAAAFSACAADHFLVEDLLEAEAADDAFGALLGLLLRLRGLLE